MKTKKSILVWTIFLVAMSLQTSQKMFGQRTDGKYVFYGRIETFTGGNAVTAPGFRYYSERNRTPGSIYEAIDYGSTGEMPSFVHNTSIGPNRSLRESWMFFDEASTFIFCVLATHPYIFLADDWHDLYVGAVSHDSLRFRDMSSCEDDHLSIGTFFAFMSVCPNHKATPKLSTSQTSFRLNDTITLTVDSAYPEYAEKDFVWEYSLDGVRYKRRQREIERDTEYRWIYDDIYGRTVKITHADIPDAELNKPIFFRLRHCGDLYRPTYTCHYNITYSDGAGSVPATFVFVRELPNFSANLYNVDVRCPNEKPQNLSLSFNRPLESDQTITGVYLFDSLDANGIPQGRINLGFSLNVDENGIIVSFRDTLPDGDYYLIMNGVSQGMNLASLSTQIRVRNPQALDFETMSFPSSGTEYHQGVQSVITDGKVELSIKNYLDDHSVFWNGNPTSNTTFLDLAQGTYSTKILFNSEQCNTIFDITVTSLNKSLNIHIDEGLPISCFGKTDASLQAVVEKNTNSEVSFSWYKNENLLPNETQQFLEHLSAGTYKVVGESDGLQSSFSFTVVEPQSLDLTVNSVIHPYCDTHDGQIHINAIGGTPPYSYDWNTGAISEFIDQLSGGIYTYNIRDSRSCEISGQFELISPKHLEVSVVERIEQTYFGSELGVIKPSENDGLIRVFAEFGTPPYTYEWSNGATDPVLTNLSFGTFHLTVRDFYLCEQSLTVELPQHFPLISTLEKISDITCFESHDASLSVHFEGGIPPYDYRWTHSDSKDLQQVGLGVGTYEFEVFDSRGVRSFDRIYIAQPGPLHVDLSADSVSGWGASDGSVHAIASGGTLPYTFEWGCSTAASVNDLQAGTYHLRLTDANGCWLEDSVVVHSPDSLTLVGQVYPCTYFGSVQGILPLEPNDGRIDCHVEGGVKPYIYQWFYQMPNHEWVQLVSKNSPYMDSLTGGRYFLRVTDSKGYSVSDTFEVVQTKPLITSISATNPLCFGHADGTLQTLVSGGIPPYTYQWNLGDTASFLQNLTIGHYAVIVYDSLGVSSTFEVTLTQPEPLTMDYFITPITKRDENEGAIFVVVKGGTEPYSYFWTNFDTIRSPQITNLGAGIYTLQITDFNGCLLSSSFAINNPDAIEVSAVIKPMSYPGSVQGRTAPQPADGEIYLTVSGGFSPYEFLWSNGEETSFLTGLSEGSYSVVVTDKYGNEGYGAFDIKSTEPLILTVNQDHLIACFGESTARLNSHVFGGTPPYTYHWNTGETKGFMDSLPAGEYHLEVVDSLNVTANFSIRIDEPTALMISANVTQPQCPNPNNGQIQLFVSGGIPSYQYLWCTDDQTAQLHGLSDGTYDVVISDANGCRENRSFILETPLTAYIQQQDFIRCFGDSTVTLELTVCGGVFPYKILWNTGDTSLVLYEQKGGLYSVVVTDGVGTVFETSIDVFEPLPLSVDGTFSNPSCFGEADGSIDVSAEGGTSPYLYRWSNMTTSSQLSDLNGGHYSLFVTDRNGCQTTYSTTLVEPEELLVDLGFDRTLCHGQVLSIFLPYDNLMYSWQKNGDFFHVGPFVELSETGMYTVIAENNLNCKTFDTLYIDTVQDHLTAEFWHSHEAVVGEDFVAANIGQTPFDYLVWSITPAVQILSQNNEYFHIRFTDTGEHEIRLTAHKNGCFDEQVGVVNVISQQENFQMKSGRKSSLSDLKIFPNPTRDQFSFSVQAEKSTVLRWTLNHATTGLVALSGQIQTDSDGFANQQISLQKQISGVYVFRVFNGKEQLSQQLIIY
ncbi:MAG: T9SS type A sorting domain-containing protein [Bacteroidales bacterium]|nr:T9SS type A sorting domain-containing protein [Bacteroidales bacterium]